MILKYFDNCTGNKHDFVCEALLKRDWVSSSPLNPALNVHYFHIYVP